MALQRRWNIDFFILIFYSTDDVWEYFNIGNAIDKTCFFGQELYLQLTLS